MSLFFRLRGGKLKNSKIKIDKIVKIGSPILYAICPI
jgi:hypothetical protein